jgi:hypothetical protein
MNVRNFCIEKEEIHKINKLPLEKPFKVIAGEKEFSFSIHQSLFLSPSFAQRFSDGEKSITLDLENDKDVSSDSLVEAFSEFYSLFIDKTEFILNSKNINAFRVLAQKIENGFLRKSCGPFRSSYQTSFSLSFEHLVSVNFSLLQDLSTLTLVLPNFRVNVNPALFSCISDSFFKMFSSDTSLTSFEISLPQELIEYFRPILNILK